MSEQVDPVKELMADLHEPTPQFTREQAIESVGAAQKRIAELEAELESARAVIAKLPKCWRLNEHGELVQDAPVTPGMKLWAIIGHTVWSGQVELRNPNVFSTHTLSMPSQAMNLMPSECYDTSKAASAALAAQTIGGAK